MPEQLDQRFAVVRRGGLHTHAFRELHPADVRVDDRKHAFCTFAPGLCTYAYQLTSEDLVAAVGEYHRNNIELLARLGPKRLDGVHGAAVTFHIDYQALRASNGRTRGHRQPAADRATSEL